MNCSGVWGCGGGGGGEKPMQCEAQINECQV